MEQRPQSWTYCVALLLFAVGIPVGTSLPDVDQRLPFLMHRSLLTHGLLLPVLLFVAIRKHPEHTARLFTMGFCLASAIHLCFDLFPRGWRGYALIWIPLHGRADATFSWLWIGAGCIVCLYLALVLVKYVFEIFLAAASLVATFAWNSSGEPRAGLSALALTAAVAAVLLLPSRAGTVLRQAAFKKR